MEYLKLTLYLLFLATIGFMLIYNWLYLVRIKTSDNKIGISAPNFIKTLLSASITVSIIAFFFVVLMVVLTSIGINSSDFSSAIIFPQM